MLIPCDDWSSDELFDYIKGWAGAGVFKFSFQIFIVWVYIAFIAIYKKGETKTPKVEKAINGATYPPML